MLRTALFAFGYPASIIVISQFFPVVRERRLPWLVVHHLAVIAIIVGWATKSQVSAVIINSSWLVASTIWYVVGGRRGSQATPTP